jgi:hypothetical protein
LSEIVRDAVEQVVSAGGQPRLADESAAVKIVAAVVEKVDDAFDEFQKESIQMAT